jgi:hypothetical protein
VWEKFVLTLFGGLRLEAAAVLLLSSAVYEKKKSDEPEEELPEKNRALQ